MTVADLIAQLQAHPEWADHEVVIAAQPVDETEEPLTVMPMFVSRPCGETVLIAGTVVED